MVRAKLLHSDGMEPKRYECLSDAADDIKVSKQILIDAHEKKASCYQKERWS